MTISKKCIGCQSNKKEGNIQYYQCKDYIGFFLDHNKQKHFRDKYFPCVQCLVKATCTDPKVSKFGYTIASEKYTNHKCLIFKRQLMRYTKEIYMGLQTRIKEHDHR